MKKSQLVFVPSIGISHLVPTVELAKHLILRDDHRFSSITFLIIPENFLAPTHAFIESVTTSFPSIRFIHLPPAELPPPDTEPGVPFLSLFVENYKPLAAQAIRKLIDSDSDSRLIGLVVDMFTTTMIDIANQLNIPSYLYFTSCAAMLGLMLHFPTLHDEFPADLKDYPGELRIPSYVNSVPPLALPPILLNKKTQSYVWMLYHARRYREVKGIVVNSASELEPRAVESFTDSGPKVYPVGPLLDLDRRNQNEKKKMIIEWLDKQPPSSVIFLCFGSRGTFGAPQVKEIAHGLEKSGHRFLWSLRKPGATRMEAPSDYTNLKEVLPEGFLQRTEGRGLVCGWAPQVDVLAHKATGGFVSHCGWNSIMESVWFGVPILTWPIDAEQKSNAFEIARDLGLAVAIRGGFKDGDDGRMIMAEEIQSGVGRLMDDIEVRKRVKEVGDKCRKAVTQGGSSYCILGCLIEDLVREGGSDA